jgi:hypothetical protein
MPEGQTIAEIPPAFEAGVRKAIPCDYLVGDGR